MVRLRARAFATATSSPRSTASHRRFRPTMHAPRSPISRKARKSRSTMRAAITRGTVKFAAQRREAWNWPMLMNEDPEHPFLPKDFNERMHADVERAQREAERMYERDHERMEQQVEHATREAMKHVPRSNDAAHGDAMVGPQPRAAQRRSRPLLRHRQGRARDRGRRRFAARHPRRRRHHEHRGRNGQSSGRCAARAARSGIGQGRPDQAPARSQDARAQHEGAGVQLDLQYARVAAGTACPPARRRPQPRAAAPAAPAAPPAPPTPPAIADANIL